jgi:phenylalanyl-tRNA synthetase beta chain
MKFSEQWLREWANPDISTEEMCEQLTMAGLEVDSVAPAGGVFANVVVACVESIEKHPDADKLNVCQVTDGSETFQVVCGASNVRQGLMIPLAKIGAVLPGNFEIKPAKLRGVESFGMLCSEKELGLADQTEGLMELSQDAPMGRGLGDYLKLDDTCIEFDLTPNRGDCLSIAGIARELGTLNACDVTEVECKPVTATVEDSFPVEIKAETACTHYAGRVVSDINTKAQTPVWMTERLRRSGIRSLGPIVDVTNYVMLEYSQPLHAFDYDLIEGRKIAVRPGGEGESIETIDGSKVPLSKDIPVIADGSGPVAIAGIMGGKRSEITESTRNILLECAFFKPGTVRMVSRSLGIASESSFRFERGVDIEAIGIAIDRAAEMILKLGGGTLVKGAVDIYPERFKPAQITLSRERVNALLGTALTMTTIKGALKRLGIATRSAQKRGTIVAEPPSYRLDIGMEADLIEEVARLTSYENIPSTLPKGAIAPSRRERPREVKRVVREILTNLGLYEVINYSFVGENTARVDGSESGSGIRLINPLSEEQVLLRKHIFPSLLENLRYNLNRENRDVRIFEIGRAFTAKENQSREREYISALLYGERYGTNWSQPRGAVDFYDVKGLLESLMAGLLTEGVRFERAGEAPFLHPGKSAKLILGEEEAGFVGEVHPTTLDDLDIEGDAFIFELSLDILVRHSSSFMRHGSVPRYPAVKRDISFIVDRAVDYEAISSYIMGVDEIIIEGVELFDVYCGGNIPADKVSMAIRVTYRSKDGTLTDGEVNQLHSRIVDGLSGQFKLEVRGVGTTPATV